MRKRLWGLSLLLVLVTACTQAPTAPPSITLDVSPTAGSVDVSVDVVVSATFNVDMNESTLDGAFTLSSAAGSVEGEWDYNAATRRLTFEPTGDLEHDTLYTASIQRTVRSSAGGRIAGATTGVYAWSFTTVEAPTEDSGVTSISVTPQSATLEVNGTQQLNATVVADSGVSQAVEWTSSNTAVATVSESGLVTAAAAGQATISATSVHDNTVSGTAAVTVLASAATSVIVSPTAAAILVDETVQFSATVVVVSGASTDVIWSSSDASVATVDQDGVATALSTGTTTITATSVATAGVTGSAELTVSDVPVVTAVALDPNTASLELGESVALTLDVTAAGGADESVTWTSSDGTVASVVDGVVTAEAAGTATITATSVFNPAISGNATITVLAAAVNSVVVTPEELTLSVGDAPVQLAVEVEAVSGADDSVTWASADESVATVVDGLVTAVSAGTATITAASVFDPSTSGSATVNVPGAEAVTVTPTAADLAVGDTVQLEEDVTLIHGATDGTVLWSSSDETVATVDADGLVTAGGPGTATITATSAATPASSGGAEITVHTAVSAGDYVSAPGYIVGATIDLDPPTVTGGLAPYTYALSGGDLPAGAAVGADGAITGTADVSGVYTGTVTVTDSLGQSDTSEFEFEVVDALVLNLYVDDTLEHNSVFAPQGLIASGGLAPFSFSEITIDPSDPEWADRYPDPWGPHEVEDQGPLAPGLGIAADGTISGTVTALGFHRTYIEVTDSLGQIDVAMLEIVVTPAPLTLSYANSPYTYTTGGALLVPTVDVTVTGGVAPYEFSWTRTSCSFWLELLCSNDQWGIDPTNGEIERTAGGADEIFVSHNSDRTYRVTVTDDAGTTATFDVSFEED